MSIKLRKHIPVLIFGETLTVKRFLNKSATDAVTLLLDQP